MKFKKQISILLASFVFMANLGYSFTVHYCNDTIATISLIENFEEPCDEPLTSCCAIEDSHDSCCSNKTIQVEKNNDNFFSKSIPFELQSPAILTNNLVSFSKQNVIYTKVLFASFYCESNGPPLYQLYSQYTLYA
jgi:hypothetical protein